MGLSSSAQKQQQPKQYQQNNMYIVDKLKSALAINKRKNPVIIQFKGLIKITKEYN